MRRSRVQRNITLAAFVAGCLLPGAVRPETLAGALAKAYLTNPDINQQRAAVRGVDEEIPKASAGFRPKLDAEADAPIAEIKTHQKMTRGLVGIGVQPPGTAPPAGFSVKARDSIWDANRTTNLVRGAESRDMAARELLRNTEQNVLLDGVTVYMNVMRDTAILELQRAHVRLLEAEESEAKERHRVGDATQTDIAEVEAELAGAQASALTAETNLQTSIADYRRTIGEAPETLAPANALSAQLPKSLEAAIAISEAEHPAILGALQGVDAAALDIKVIESQLYPTVDLKGLVDRRYNVATAAIPTLPFVASLTGQVNAPVYDGGLTFASTRQAKETLDQRELQADLQRDKARAAVVSAWSRNESAPAIVAADQQQITAAALAFEGVREEHKYGKRTVIELLTAEETLLLARIQLVSAQRDEVIASYQLLSAVGRLSPTTLRLQIPKYDPVVHFNQVKDKWFGLRTPDGR